MLNAQGYACITEPDKKTIEADTHSCAHCNRIIHVPIARKFEHVGDFCRSCMKVICARCAHKRVCVPFLKKLDKWSDQNPENPVPFEVMWRP